MTQTNPPIGFYHRKRYQEYTNKVSIERFIRKQQPRATVVQDATASQTTLPSQERSRRSAILPTNFALCVICQRNTSKQKRSQSTHHCYAWLSGTKLRRRCISLTDIAVNLNEDKSAALLGICAFLDTTRRVPLLEQRSFA